MSAKEMKWIGFILIEEFIMRTVPKTLVEKVQFYETHLAAFTNNAAEIGLSEDETAALAVKAAAARQALRERNAAEAMARAATLHFNLAVEELGTLGSSMIAKIRATAEGSGNPNVYSLAQIPPIAEGSPIPAPGTPYLPKTKLDGDGSLILTWKCDNPRGSVGTMYQIARKVVRAGQTDFGEFIPLDVVGKKRFRDETIPAGATQLVYQIRAIRSTKLGNAQTFNVYFGTNGQTMTTTFQTRAAA